MKILRQFAFATLAMWFIASSATMSFAGDPSSRVARLKYISGDVSMQPGGVNDWAAATINRPITTADRLWSDKNSRVELHLGSAAMRMDSETSLTVTNLNDSTVQLEVDQGTLNLQVARMYRGEIYEVDTPNTAFTILKSGNYRFDVDSNGDATLVTVWKGKGVATGQGQAVRIESRHRVRFMGGMSLAHASYKAPKFDGFDQWCQVRDQRESRSETVRYVSHDVVGYEDLAEYGSWREIPDYGPVWTPTRVEAGWAPYRYGSWAWVEPWGWTWIDDAPWGFAPFHYGRWVAISGSWAWVPGPVNARPCYAPALVAWIGSSGAGVGWFPLGYGEPYVPNYHVSRNYFQVVNVSNTRISNITYVTNNYYNVNDVRITNIRYVNQTTAITVVNNDVLVNSRRVGRDVFIDRDRDWHDHHDGWVTAGPPVAPSRHSVLGLHADRPAPEPPERILNKRVVVNAAPPERPVPFESKRADLEDHHGRPLDSSEEDRLRKRMPVQTRPDRSENAQTDRQHDAGPSNNRRPDDGNRGNAVADERRDYPSRVPRPPKYGDNEHAQPISAGDINPNPRQDNQNSGAGKNEHQRPGNPQNAQNEDSKWNRQQPDNASAGRQAPRPPMRNYDRNDPTSAGGNSPYPHQANQNPGGTNGDQQRSANSENSPNPNSNRQQPDNASAGRWVPRPPNHGDNDRKDAASVGGNSPYPRQANQSPSVDSEQRRPDPQQNSQNNNSRWNRQPQQAQGSPSSNAPQPSASSPAPPQVDPSRNRHAPSDTDRQVRQSSYSDRSGGSQPAPQAEREISRPPAQSAQPVQRSDNSGPSRDVRPAYSQRSAPAPEVQQANRPMPRPPQADRNDSHASAPAARAPETPRPAAPVPAAAGKDSGSTGNPHGANQFQDRDHGKPQDH